MKTLKNKLILVLFAGLFAFTACDTDILNVDPSAQLSDASVWNDPILIDLYLADIYRRMHHGLDEVMLESLTDNAHFIHGYGVPDILQGNAGPSALAAWNRDDLRHLRWGHLYSAIRQTNIMLTQLPESNVTDDFRDDIIGETLFLRAYFYHNLLRMYGGVPLIDRAYELDDDFEIARNSFAETVEFIISDLEAATPLLPENPRDLGRIDRGAALALKSRVLTFAASDLFDNPASELTGYTSGDQAARHQRAYNAARDVIDTGYYELFNRHDDPAFNYEQIFLINDDHEETILARFFVGSRDWDDRWLPAQFNGPNGYRGWAGNTPIQALVDAYEMADGSEFDWNNPEHASAPYENRDPRFYASILYDGAPWVTPPAFRVPYDLHGHIQTFQEVVTPEGTFAGVDTRLGPIEDWNGSYTRYYIRKFIDPGMPLQDRQETPYPYLRYAEIILNAAEAQLGMGNEAEARQYMNQIRQRAGMPDITDGGQRLVERFQNERRIEMFGEEQRYFDVRRWMIAPDVLDNDAQGIRITAEATDHRDRSTYSNYTYELMSVPSPRSWNNSHYFTPIPFDEMNRNLSLIQNPGY